MCSSLGQSILGNYRFIARRKPELRMPLKGSLLKNNLQGNCFPRVCTQLMQLSPRVPRLYSKVATQCILLRPDNVGQDQSPCKGVTSVHCVKLKVTSVTLVSPITLETPVKQGFCCCCLFICFLLFVGPPPNSPMNTQKLILT